MADQVRHDSVIEQGTARAEWLTGTTKPSVLLFTKKSGFALRNILLLAAVYGSGEEKEENFTYICTQTNVL